MLFGFFRHDKYGWTGGRIVCRHDLPACFLYEEERVSLTLTLFGLPGIASASFDFPPSDRTERGTSLIRQGVADTPRPEGTGVLPSPSHLARFGLTRTSSGCLSRSVSPLLREARSRLPTGTETF